RLGASAPLGVEFSEVGDRLLHDLPADADGADQLPVPVDLPVFPARRVTQVHYPVYRARRPTKSTYLVATTRRFRPSAADGRQSYNRRGMHRRAGYLLNCGSWARLDSLIAQLFDLSFVGAAERLAEGGIEVFARLSRERRVALDEQIPQLRLAIHRQEIVEHGLDGEALVELLRTEARQHFFQRGAHARQEAELVSAQVVVGVLHRAQRRHEAVDL